MGKEKMSGGHAGVRHSQTWVKLWAGWSRSSQRKVTGDEKVKEVEFSLLNA